VTQNNKNNLRNEKSIIAIRSAVQRNLVVSEEVGCDFISEYQCKVTTMPNGEHWFHTPEQLAYMKAWEKKIITI